MKPLTIGCHFVKSLCLESIELCYDDLVFGKCLSKVGVEQEDIEKRPLTEEQSRIMATMLEEMQGAGLGWDHPFVQCRVQGTLFSMRRNTMLPPNLCANLAPDPDILSPQSPLAFVRFTPPSENFADEVYYPPLKKDFNEQSFSQLFLPPEELHTSSELSQNNPVPHRFTAIENAADEKLSNRIKDIKNRMELRRIFAEYELEKFNPYIYKNEELYPYKYLHNTSPTEDENELIETYKRKGPHLEGANMESSEEDKELLSSFFREMVRNHQTGLNTENVEDSSYKNNLLEVLLPSGRTSKSPYDDEAIENNYFPENTYPKKYSHHHLNLKSPESEGSGVYTEGGLIYVPERSEAQILGTDVQAKNLLANMLGFTRRERLDVKKPGPLVGPPSSAQISDQDIGGGTPLKFGDKEILPTHVEGDSSHKHKKLMSGDHSDENHAPHTVDTEYAHVILKHPLDNWNDGARIVSALADVLNMKKFFTHPRVDRHEVTFRVEDNPEKKTAADIAHAINDSRLKNSISRRLGVTVIRAGVGDKIKSDPDFVSKKEIAEESQDLTHIMAYMFAGAGAAAVVVILVVLFLISRHDRKKNKLNGLQAGLSGTESCSKDYQDLCRARMAGKGITPSETISSGRITSLTKENDKPPSSRSSTSSWSEEPALTNMDISTGHMVLSYMEDHLRNKGRLQREWEALCGYEAEPSAREAALQTQCTPFNRPGAPLPYDHSRVVLNHLANAEGLDYINASTITDHDPRAPAYIAAQGPLPTTLAHFWQMIWEQGAVVIVALCRLQENGEIACARYWPEEGAEVYHIYEVHLVSEHILCDDYLVRSFYLKNLRTSETRTVTQFHFLSWPQGGVPSSAKALLEFRRKVNKSYRGRSCPIVVHDSTGSGRTGAYILLDLVLGRMNKGAREIDIAATLEHLRDQRAGLVATKQQFEFVLMAVAEEVHAILKALPANQGEKRELDKEAVKEEDTQGETTNLESTTEKAVGKGDDK